MGIPAKPGLKPSSAGGSLRTPAINTPSSKAPTGKTPRSIGGLAMFIFAGLGLGAIVIGLFAAPLLIKEYNDRTYSAQYIEVEMIREATKTTRPSIDIEKTFSKENMKAMEGGKGLKVIMVTTVRGREISRRTVLTLEPWEKYEATSNPARRRNIAEIREQLTNMVTKFEINQTWVIDFVLDDTEGVDLVLAQKAKAIFDKLEVDERIKIGDGVDISFTRLSKGDYLQRDQIIVPVKSGNSGKYQEVLAGFNNLLTKRLGTSESSVARGLLNALNANSGRENREIIIISDGLENSSQTGITFYEKKGGLEQLKPSNWEKLDQAFLADGQQPQLNGATVSWYAPPAAANHSKEVQLGFKYWEHLLGNLGAIEVKTHFGD